MYQTGQHHVSCVPTLALNPLPSTTKWSLLPTANFLTLLAQLGFSRRLAQFLVLPLALKSNLLFPPFFANHLRTGCGKQRASQKGNRTPSDRRATGSIVPTSPASWRLCSNEKLPALFVRQAPTDGENTWTQTHNSSIVV